MSERYTFSDEMPAPPSRYGYARRFGVWDHRLDEPALLPNAVVCWGMTQDGALDALIELQGGARAEALRDE